MISRPVSSYLIIFHFWNGFLNGYIPMNEGEKSLKREDQNVDIFPILNASWNLGFSSGVFHCVGIHRLN